MFICHVEKRNVPDLSSGKKLGKGRETVAVARSKGKSTHKNRGGKERSYPRGEPKDISSEKVAGPSYRKKGKKTWLLLGKNELIAKRMGLTSTRNYAEIKMDPRAKRERRLVEKKTSSFASKGKRAYTSKGRAIERRKKESPNLEGEDSSLSWKGVQCVHRKGDLRKGKEKPVQEKRQR